MSTVTVKSTRDYDMFVSDKENRILKENEHKRLQLSMERYGFLKCFPIVVKPKNKKGKHVVKEGQHRLHYAEHLGLEVWYIEEEKDFDIAVINCTAVIWKTKDYAEKFAKNGYREYVEAVAFSEKYRLNISIACAMLAGYVSFSNIRKEFYDGAFVVKDRGWAEEVAELFSSIREISPFLKGERPLKACMCVCRVDGFDSERLIRGISSKRNDLRAPFGDRQSCLQFFEDCYNSRKSNREKFSLKNEAIKAMNERNAVSSEDDQEDDEAA